MRKHDLSEYTPQELFDLLSLETQAEILERFAQEFSTEKLPGLFNAIVQKRLQSSHLAQVHDEWTNFLERYDVADNHRLEILQELDEQDKEP